MPWGSSGSVGTAQSHASSTQGLTLVHISAQRKRFLWDRGCTQGSFRGCLGGDEGCDGVFRVDFVSETAQVELKGGRVLAPASTPRLSDPRTMRNHPPSPQYQGLTLVHFSAKLKRLLCDRGCSYGLFRGCLVGARGY
jgi:hypothetical protein